MKPPKKIPIDLLIQYTMGGKIPVSYLYFDGTEEEIIRHTKKQIDEYIFGKIWRRENNYYGDTDKCLYRVLDAFPIKDKDVLVIGSYKPWYEAIAIDYGCKSCTVFEYNLPECDDDRIVYTLPDYTLKFDAIISISSFEHDGLGRYGDPLNPNGDLETMAKLRGVLGKNGRMYLSVPEGNDELVWNAHRIYGDLRRPLLLEGYKEIIYCTASNLFQPIRLLEVR